ncbi:Butirosin biosynthesis, BtrG-like protein [Mycena alexandri]|uniref:gamma-glutamylcyclotransferase n=1 Tax=Mycena alexandri TaxID=1745969 RepID=A0AAD6TI69_9AGAR|nr:Butirosin biosynthesis, BtrG-like protein [Mycena alexandri]
MSFNPKTLYFGYGSNLCKQQMYARCPENKFLGTARLADWRWIINTRGYANIVPSQDDEVWALVYELSPADEDKLDIFEGVPDSYVKQTVPVEYYGKKGYGEMRDGKRMVDALVYVDVERVTEGPPKTEYIRRMNAAIADALTEGISKTYIEKYLRPCIPVQETTRKSK